MYEEITAQTTRAITELLDKEKMKAGDIFFLGCSSSEILGENIGKGSNPEVAAAVFDAVYPLLYEKEIYLAAQCCEHLNRALIIEREAAERYGYEIVNVIPQPKAGGSFATRAYFAMKDPVAVEHVRANAGMDIGGTLIGMHLADVAVPVRLSLKKIGQATLICARTRHKFIGGSRAAYKEE